MVDVIVAEPNPLLRASLHAVFAGWLDVSIVAEIGDAAGLVAALPSVPCDVVLAGLGLLREVGADPLRAWRRQRGGGLLVHSYEWDLGFAREAARFDAAGYFSHECSPQDLHAAVLAVAAGRPFITGSLGAELADAACFRAVRLDAAGLSAREERIYKMLVLGLRPAQIAAQMGIRVRDVVASKRRILGRVDVPDAGTLVRHAIAQACRAWPHAAPDDGDRLAQGNVQRPARGV